ncbi:MAG: hypothetical protein ACK5MA_07105 [Parachlamydiaceae bacterium]
MTNLISSQKYIRQFVDNYIYAPENYEPPNPRRLERCVRLFRKTTLLNISEKHLWIYRAQCYIADLPASETKERVSKVAQTYFEEVGLQKNSIDLRVAFIQKFLGQIIPEKTDILIEHLVLDSVIRPPHTGTTIGIALTYLMQELRAFQANNNNSLIFDLIRILEFAHTINTFQQDTKSNFHFLDYYPKAFYKAHLNSELHKMETQDSDVFPYLIVPIQSKKHGIAATVQWNEDDRFILTIINTGLRTTFRDEEGYCYDAVYRGLTRKELIRLFMAMVPATTSFETLIRHFNLKLPECYAKPEKGRRHQLQKGSSCVSQSLMSAIHSLLPDEKLYRLFKSFMTTQLLSTGKCPAEYQQDAVKIAERRLHKTFL